MNRWFRFYDDAINDPKVVGLSDECYRGWVGLLCVASKHKGILPPVSDLSFYLRMKPQRVAALIAQLVSAKLLDRVGETYEPHNWGGRQYISDSTERVKRHREKRAAAGLARQWQPSKELRKEVYVRDNYECVYCGSPDDLTIDHKVPEFRGGSHDVTNLQTACRSCNASKRDLTHDEFVTRGVTGNVTSAFQERPQSTEYREQKEDRIGSAGASSFTDGSKTLATSFLNALGFDTPLKVPPEFAGVDWRAIEWERAGWTSDLIESEARKNAGKPLSYHEKCFATAFAKRQAPLPVAVIKKQETLHVAKSARGGISSALDRLIEQAEGNAVGGFEGGQTTARLLSNG